MTYSKHTHRTLSQPPALWDACEAAAAAEGVGLSEWAGAQLAAAVGRPDLIPRQRKGRPRVHDVSAAEVAALRAEGATLRGIAERLGVSVRVVRDRLAEAGRGDE